MNSKERSPSVKKRFVCWDEMDLYIPRLKMKLDNSEYHISELDAVVAIRRGGIVPALALSHYYNKPLIIIDAFDFDPNDLPKQLLIVDDVIDTGQIYYKICEKIAQRSFSFTLFATLFRKPWAPKDNPRIFAVVETSDWLVMPWE